ncbi:MipA/OmpV family protein [Glaciecola siphonariae]|uniref:MipA/OmpV family protein n=1 Tax=Glaciecola siphonariae TaxID=521012 RepID=A0ABV9LT83_9ALTE
MKLNLSAVLLLGTTSLFVSSSYAQWSAGVGAVGSATPYKGLSTEFIVIPIAAYEGERVIWRGPSLQYKITGLNRNEPSLRLSVDLAPNALEADESDELTGIEERDLSFLAGVRYIYPTAFGEFSGVYQTDVSNKHNGQRGALNFERLIASAANRSWAITAGLQLEHLSDNYANYYFGVSQQEAAVSEFSAYDLDAVWQGGVTVGGYYRFANNWQLVAQSRWLSLASDIKNSPIVDGSSTIDGFVGLTYQF